MEKLKRCDWAEGQFQAYQEYHDHEWGRPEYDDQKLFEMLILEGAQAGLSWATVLKKRAKYREVFYHFDVQKVARMGEEDLHSLMQEVGIIRNRLKISATLQNAKEVLRMKESGESLSDFFWKYQDGQAILHHFKSMAEVPASTPVSEKISKELKKRGFRFVGPTIIYAFMQAIGMVNDHLTSCFCHPDNEAAKR